MNQPEFGHELVKIRKAKGLTQSELAEKCNVSKRTIQRIEAGLVIPRSFTIKTLSDALDFDFLKEFPYDLSGNKETGHKRFILINQIITQTVDLFNLKTNTMRKLSILTIIFGIIGIGLFIISNKTIAQSNTEPKNFLNIGYNETISKSGAIKVINEIKRKATFNNQAIDLIKSYAKKSYYNYDTYVLLSELIGSFGHSTKHVLDIANIVYFTNKDCDLFNEIAPLIFLYNHDSNIYVKLAKEASEAKSNADKDKIREQIINYKEKSEFKTLEDAFNSQKKI